jgi:hypothetical protein
MGIRDLSEGTPTTASQVPFFDPINGVDRRCSLSELISAALGEDASDAEGWITQYAAPNASGFTVVIAPAVDGQSVWLLLLPTGAFAAGTITLPAQTTLRDRQEVEILCSQNLAAITVAGNGASVNGAPASLTANVAVKLRFDDVTDTWYPAV